MNKQDRYGENWCESPTMAEEAAMTKYDEEQTHEHFDDEVKILTESFSRRMCLVLMLMAQAAEHRPELLFILVERACGMTQAQIGRILGIQRQMVHKHINRIGEKNPVLGEYLHTNKAQMPFISNEFKAQTTKVKWDNKLRSIMYGQHKQ